MTALLLLLSSAVLRAEIYRWVDENGQVHYEDRSREQRDRGVRSYTVPSAPGETPTDRLNKTRKLLNAYEAERRQERERRELQEQEASERQRKCNIARDDLRRYQGYSGIYRLNKQGEREYLSAQEREALLQRSRKRISQYCD